MADNVGNADARPDLELEAELGAGPEGTLTEQELAAAEAPCGAVGVGIALPGVAERDDLRPRREKAGGDDLRSGREKAGGDDLRSRPSESESSGHPRQVFAPETAAPDAAPHGGGRSEPLPQAANECHPRGAAHHPREAANEGHPRGAAHHPVGVVAGHPAGVATERQRHGGARSVGFRPGGGEAAAAYEARTGIKAPRIIAWEITRSCNLSCVHCRAAAEFGHYPGELSLDQIKATIDDIVTITNPIFILTGGEPLMRPDIWEIVDYCHEKGAMPVIGTNATLITEEIAALMKAHRIPRISVSIDFPTAEGHDTFRGQPGCFDATIEGIRIAKRHGVGVQINTTVTTLNAHLIEEIHDLAESLGVDAFHIFMLVPTGRGEDLLAKELPPEEYERVLEWAYERQKTSPLHFKPTDAPHYYRIIRQKAKAEGKKVTREEYGLEAMTRGCLGGITFCFISHVGDIQPCGYFDMQLGNVKERPFTEIWTGSPVFNDLRDYSLLKGKCGACEYRAVCGGCRARALSVTGDYLAEEPYCVYVPASMRGECEE